VLFGADPLAASAEAFSVVRREVGVTTVPADALGDVVSVLARTPLASSNSDARRTLAQRGYRVNGQVLDDTTTSLVDVPRIDGRDLLLRRGKTSYHVVECAAEG
jgi:tyrosyl-tRNA synthetase